MIWAISFLKHICVAQPMTFVFRIISISIMDPVHLNITACGCGKTLAFCESRGLNHVQEQSLDRFKYQYEMQQYIYLS